MNTIDISSSEFIIAFQMLVSNENNFDVISREFYDLVINKLIESEHFEIVRDLKKIDSTKIKDISFEEMMNSITIIPFYYNLN